MNDSQFGRRRFMKEAAATAAGIVVLSGLSKESLGATNPERILETSSSKDYITPRAGRIKFSVIGINHGHISSQVEAVTRGGGEFVSFYAKEPDLAAAFAKRFPQVKQASNENEILDDKSIHLVLSAGIPADRAPLGIRVMRAGKDYMSDKPGMTTLEQLAEVRRVQKETKRIYSIMYSERLENRATIKAGNLVKDGAIGKVIQTIGLGPHKETPKSRPGWFFDKKYFGGIITDIGSHQFDQYLFFTGSKKAEVVASQVRNVAHADHPDFEDFGDVMLRGDGGTGYIRIDWFTPEQLNTFGDGRLTVLGTEGFIEIRKNMDIGGRTGGNHLFLVDKKGTNYVDCSKEPLSYGPQLVDDILNRTETAMTQEHCFLAMELALKAQKQAVKV
jgi:predicted dehydrogenase